LPVGRKVSHPSGDARAQEEQRRTIYIVMLTDKPRVWTNAEPTRRLISAELRYHRWFYDVWADELRIRLNRHLFGW